MLFFSFFKTLVNHEITVELKNDISIRGTLKSVDQYLNIKLDDISVVEELKYPHLVGLDDFGEDRRMGGKKSKRKLMESIIELGQECLHSRQCGAICASACCGGRYAFVGGCDEERYVLIISWKTWYPRRRKERRKRLDTDLLLVYTEASQTAAKAKAGWARQFPTIRGYNHSSRNLLRRLREREKSRERDWKCYCYCCWDLKCPRDSGSVVTRLEVKEESCLWDSQGKAKRRDMMATQTRTVWPLTCETRRGVWCATTRWSHSMFLRTVLVSFSMLFVYSHHSSIFICASLTLDIEDHRPPCSCLCFSYVYHCFARQSHFFLLETGKKKQYLVTHSTPTSTTTPGPTVKWQRDAAHPPLPSSPDLLWECSVYLCVFPRGTLLS